MHFLDWEPKRLPSIIRMIFAHVNTSDRSLVLGQETRQGSQTHHVGDAALVDMKKHNVGQEPKLSSLSRTIRYLDIMVLYELL